MVVETLLFAVFAGALSSFGFGKRVFFALRSSVDEIAVLLFWKEIFCDILYHLYIKFSCVSVFLLILSFVFIV